MKDKKQAKKVQASKPAQQAPVKSTKTVKK